MMPQPISQKPLVVTANTMKFFERMFTQFFARHMPDSTVAKPRFMKNTSMPVTSTQTVSAITLSSALVGAAGAAGAGGGGVGGGGERRSWLGCRGGGRRLVRLGICRRYKC